MQKIKAFFFLVMVTIIVSYTGGGALAAEVTKVNVSQGHVYIDAGKEAGFIMGSDVCFYSYAGERIACGTVRQISAARATVKVKNREAKLIKRGMWATFPRAAAD
ncbi:MAG: hypothetical protein JRJ46_13270 [Deltaproteobacteria bacterium]|nr:hypothetical protein [Deltaproteobacteria bacterium]